MATPHPHRKAIPWLQGPIEEYCIRPVEMAGSMSRSISCITGQKLREIPSQDGCGQVSVLFKRALPESSFLLVRDGRCPLRKNWQLRYCADIWLPFSDRAFVLARSQSGFCSVVSAPWWIDVATSRLRRGEITALGRAGGETQRT
jgi:hypothetical protein